MADVANAALQFSMTWTGLGDETETVGTDLDVRRLRRLIRSYGSSPAAPIGREELGTLPWLMTEALVLESVIPIAATGTFGSLSGSKFLRMVEGKVNWMRPRAEKLVRYVRERR